MGRQRETDRWTDRQIGTVSGRINNRISGLGVTSEKKKAGEAN